jgi:hypothetical protein
MDGGVFNNRSAPFRLSTDVAIFFSQDLFRLVKESAGGRGGGNTTQHQTAATEGTCSHNHHGREDCIASRYARFMNPHQFGVWIRWFEPQTNVNDMRHRHFVSSMTAVRHDLRRLGTQSLFKKQ